MVRLPELLLGVAIPTFVSVLERTAEIGLRRSLSARPRHVASQFLAESGAWARSSA